MQKKYYLSCLLFLFTSVLLSQTRQLPSQKISIETYAKLKKQGLLKSDVNYVIVGSESQVNNLEAFKMAEANIRDNIAKNKFAKSQSSDSCRCFQKVDSTFSVVPLSQGAFPGVAPDYRCDDCFSASIPLPFSFCFFGTTYTSCFINNNGNITFNAGSETFSSTGFPTNSNSPMIAPFWGDVDTKGVGSGLVKYRITPHYMVVSWDTVGYFNSKFNKRNTFQLIISDGTDSIVKGNGNVAFCYGNMEWTTGEASNGVNGLGGIPATVGFDKGNGIKYAQLGRFDTNTVAYDGPGGNNDGVKWLDNKSFNFNTCASNNFPPVAVGSVGECNVVNICNIGDTLYYEAKFVGPEVGQIITMSANLPAGISGFFVKSSQSGTTGKMVVGVVNDGTNFGTHYFSIIGTDNGSPNESSSVFFTVNISNSGSACPSGFIRGNKTICKGTQTVLKKPLCGTSKGIWSTGALIDSIIVPIGEYYYTLTDSLGCSRSFIANVVNAPNSVPVIKGPDTLCSNSPFFYTLLNSQNFQSYTWANGTSNAGVTVDPNLIVDSFNLVVTAINQYGCLETKKKKIISIVAFALDVIRQGSDTARKACPIELSKFKAIPANSGSYTYNWIDVASNNDLGFTDSISVIGPKNISVIVKKKNVCTLVKNINIKPRAAIPVTIQSNKLNNVICPIDTLKLSAINSVYFAPFKYQWSPSFDSTKVISPRQDTTYTVVVKDAFGCSGTAKFNILRIPNIEVVGKDFCKGDTVDLEVNSFTGIAALNWTTIPSVGVLPSDTMIKISKAAQYVATIVDNNNCKMFDTLEVNYFFQPSIVLNTTATSPQLINSNFDLSLQITPYNSAFFKEVNWDLGDGTIKNGKQIGLSHQYTTVKQHQVKVDLLDTNNCRLTEFISIQSFDAIPELNVFTPNGDGINDVLVFKYLDLFTENSLRLYDRWGKKAYEKENYANDWSPKDLINGTYFYVLEIKNPAYNKTFTGYLDLVK
jgi:gliding motility-associated-like protein